MFCRSTQPQWCNSKMLEDYVAESSESIEFTEQYVHGNFFNNWIARPLLLKAFKAQHEWYNQALIDYKKWQKEELDVPIDQELYDQLTREIEALKQQMQPIGQEIDDTRAEIASIDRQGLIAKVRSFCTLRSKQKQIDRLNAQYKDLRYQFTSNVVKRVEIVSKALDTKDLMHQTMHEYALFDYDESILDQIVDYAGINIKPVSPL